MGSNAHDVAQALGISAAELVELRRRLKVAKKSAPGIAGQCRCLGVAENELVGLQKVLGRSGKGANGVVRATIRTILRDREKGVDPRVFVVSGSEVYHRSVSCEFVRRAQLTPMSKAQAKRNGLRVCKHCKNEADTVHLAPIREASAFADAPDALPAPRTAKKSQSSRKKASSRTKRERDLAAAARAGITVDQLKQRRRAQAARNLALSERAKGMGMTAKQLRKLIEEGSELPEV